MNSIIREILGPNATTEDMERCVTSIMGQIMFQAHIRSPYAPPPVRRQDAKAEEMESLIRHITEFSLAGMKKIRDAREEGRAEQ